MVNFNMIKRSIAFPPKLSFFLFGPRQTGKSTLVRERFAGEKMWTVDLLNNDVFLHYARDPHLFRLEAEKQFKREDIRVVFVDEVQKVPALLDEVHGLIESFPGRRFILTGSSARKLRRGGANLLAGRAVERHLFPLTYAELGDSFDFDEVILNGSLPVLLDRSPEEKRDMLRAYVHTYLREEIKSEGLARNVGDFSRFLEVAAAQCGEQVSFSAVARECGVSVHTVQTYYGILEDTLVGLRLLPWRKSVRKRLSLQPKFYFFDMGVTNAVNRRLQEPPDPLTKGRLFEQFIVLEVHRRLAYRGSEAALFFWRTSNGAEVDVLIERHGRIRAAVEVKLSPRVAGANLTGLRSFREDHPDVPLFLVNTGRNAVDVEGVSILPWREFMDRHLDTFL
jgi:predicted AAA+ superfamily ATPase